MARGSESKEIIKNKILELFPGSFVCNDGREIRIPMQEAGEQIEIKVALTAAKTNIGGIAATESNEINFENAGAGQSASSLMPTAEEKQEVEELCRKLGFI
jgi:hypothetical protein